MPDTVEIPKVQTIVVNGRTFVPYEDSTIEQDQYIALILEESGLSKLRSFNPLTDDFTEASRLLVMRAFATGKLFALLGALLDDPHRPEFSLEMAKERSEFLRKLKRPVDKDQLRGAIVALIMGFFVSGAWFERVSGKYSLSAATETIHLSPKEISGDLPDTTMENGMTS